MISEALNWSHTVHNYAWVSQIYFIKICNYWAILGILKMKINLLKEKSSDSLNVQILYTTKIELKKAKKGEIVGILCKCPWEKSMHLLQEQWKRCSQITSLEIELCSLLPSQVSDFSSFCHICNLWIWKKKSLFSQYLAVMTIKRHLLAPLVCWPLKSFVITKQYFKPALISYFKFL